MVIIDTDPSADDAIGLMLAMASPELQILGMTAASGVCEASRSIQNIMRIQELCGHPEIPAVQGAEMPLLRTLCCDDAYCGADGLSETGLPKPKKKALHGTAASFIAKTAREHPGELSIIELAPMTNLALALREEPALPSLVKEIITIDGNYGLYDFLKEERSADEGRAGAGAKSGCTEKRCRKRYIHAAEITRAEWNILQDPEAAELVFSSGIPIRAAGLDVTAGFDDGMAEVLLAAAEHAALENKVHAVQRSEASFYAHAEQQRKKLEFFRRALAFNLRRGLNPCSLLVDSAAVALCIRPSLCTFQVGSARVVKEGEDTGKLQFSRTASQLNRLSDINADRLANAGSDERSRRAEARECAAKVRMHPQGSASVKDAPDRQTASGDVYPGKKTEILAADTFDRQQFLELLIERVFT